MNVLGIMQPDANNISQKIHQYIAEIQAWRNNDRISIQKL